MLRPPEMLQWKAPPSLTETKFCNLCCKQGATKRCGPCKTSYCSAACQRKDWPSHKKCCGLAARIRAVPRNDQAAYETGVATALGVDAGAVAFAVPTTRHPETCAICLEEFSFQGGHIYMNCCSQFIHLRCSQQKLKYDLREDPFGMTGNQACPLCRAPSPPIERAAGDRVIVERLRGHVARADASAQYQMGCDLIHGSLPILGRDVAEGLKLLEASARGGSFGSLMGAQKLAYLYIYDRAVNPEDYDLGRRGVNYAAKVARQGGLGCMVVLAECYLKGYFVEQDQAKAVKLLACAAFRGDDRAKNLLAHTSWDKPSLARADAKWPAPLADLPEPCA